MKNLLLPILTGVILATPCVHAMTGKPASNESRSNYSYRNPENGFSEARGSQKPFKVDEFISSILPQRWRLSQEYRDEIKYMKEKTGITIPIICAKTYDLRIAGGARNIGIGPLRFAIILLNEDHMNNHGLKDFNALTIAHELTHVERNHGGAVFTAALVAASLARERSGLASELKLPSRAVARATWLALILACLYTSRSAQYETEAEEGAFQKLQQLGYCKALEEQRQRYNRWLSIYPKTMRINGDIYPTLEEYSAMSEKACKACQGINPAERPDTPNIMRNGPSPLKQDVPVTKQDDL